MLRPDSDENIEKDKEIEELKSEVSILKSMVTKLMQKLDGNDENNFMVS